MASGARTGGCGPSRRRVGLATVVAVAIGLTGCGDTSEDPGSSGSSGVRSVIATTSIWADIVANVACGGIARVESLFPRGSDPHAFEPSLADRGRMEQAVLVVANGLSLEAGLEDTLDAVAQAGTPVVRMAEHVETISYSEDHDHGGHDEHAEHGEGSEDPHVWFDPSRVSEALPELAESLIAAGLDSGGVEDCLVAYQEELFALDEEVADIVSTVPDARRRLVTTHDALGYFADRYGFEVVGTVIPASSGLAATNPAHLEELAELIIEAGIDAVFAESQHSVEDVEALAERIGDVEVVTLLTGTLGDAGSGADTYPSWLTHNALLIAESLG